MFLLTLIAFLICFSAPTTGSQPAQPAKDIPEPPVVTPAPAQVQPTPPPSDAVVLFDGTSMDAWQHADGKPAQWTPDGKKDGAMTCKPGSGSILSKQKFGDIQLHVEFATPAKVEGEGQGRGNSGVYIQNRYEVQVLDSYQNKTYPNGQCGAVYLQHVPLANACRKPGEWQTYDIVFRAPRFKADGSLEKPGSLTVLHNGVLIQDHVEIKEPTGGGDKGTGDGPIHLQDHGNTVKYRNIWVRPLGSK
ncbi:MAG: hypothetical protein AMXMBFR58_29970 [Phycisphaerae bacterium]